MHTKSPASDSAPPVRYATFKARAIAFVTDIFMIGMPITLLIMLLFGHDQVTQSAGGIDVVLDPDQARAHAPNPYASVLQMVLYLGTYVLFWRYGGQTPGKKMMHIRVVDALTMHTASWGQLMLRYVGYFVSVIVLLGFFYGLFRRDGRTLHDLISGTAVIEA